jgi:hypothetical protein
MSSERSPLRAPEPSEAGAPTPEPRTAEVAVWLGQFSRTLKTCRLYDAMNPTSLKFREDLAVQLASITEAHGAISLEFTATEVRCDGQAVLTARTREDNFAMPFYRDGLRTLTFQPGVVAAELGTVIDLVLLVTGRRSNGSEDLVTLLWDADLAHVDMTYVSAETDADLGDEGEDAAHPSTERSAEPMPWPGGGAGAGGGAHAGPGEAAGQATTVTGVRLELVTNESTMPLRSEDWLASDPVHELEACYDEIEPTRAEEAERFTREMLQEREAGLVERMLALVRSTLASDLREDDRADLTALLRRMLHESIGDARWSDTREIVECLAAAANGAWDPSPLLDEFTHPQSLVTAAVVRHLDAGNGAELGEFTTFARTLGAPAAQWLMCIVALAGHQRTRRTLLRTITDLCAGRPEGLASWLADERWYVVRNAVIVVGSAEGGAPPALLRPLVGHPEPRVRQEVVAALAHMPPDAAQPLLLDLICDSEPAVRGAALHRLGTRRNAEAAQALLRIVLEPGFRKRPIEEVRSVTAALGGCGGDEALPGLEEQITTSHWFGGGEGPYCQAIARCIARIGTSAALALLERGAASRSGATRDACQLVLKGMHRG